MNQVGWSMWKRNMINNIRLRKIDAGSRMFYASF
jgi:hypothetical protein